MESKTSGTLAMGSPHPTPATSSLSQWCDLDGALLVKESLPGIILRRYVRPLMTSGQEFYR